MTTHTTILDVPIRGYGRTDPRMRVRDVEFLNCDKIINLIALVERTDDFEDIIVSYARWSEDRGRYECFGWTDVKTHTWLGAPEDALERAQQIVNLLCPNGQPGLIQSLPHWGG